jgi:hypothetical protein
MYSVHKESVFFLIGVITFLNVNGQEMYCPGEENCLENSLFHDLILFQN